MARNLQDKSESTGILMDTEEQMQWMEKNLVILAKRAAKNGVGAYIIYAELLAAAAGVGSELDEELKQDVHEDLRREIDDEVIDWLDSEDENS